MHVVDLATGSQVRSQVVTVGGQQFVRAEAPNIPSVGYKVFEIRTGAGQAFEDGPTASATTGVKENMSHIAHALRRAGRSRAWWRSGSATASSRGTRAGSR